VENNQPISSVAHELLNAVFIKVHIQVFWVMTPFRPIFHSSLPYVSSASNKRSLINYFMTPQRMLRFSDTKSSIKWLCMVKGL